MVTDTLRALLLEWCGYSTTVFEFIGGEHTAKNVMIAAIKKPRVLGPESGVGVGAGGGGESDISRNLLRAKELLASIDAADKLKKLEKKKKFQSVSVNEFGDVDVDSYDEPSTTTAAASSAAAKRAHDNGDDNDDNKQKLNDIANMIINNERVAIIEEKEESAAIARRISNLMKTFGVKSFKLFDLIFENEAEEMKRNKNKIGSVGERNNLNSDKESSSEESSEKSYSSTEGMERTKKQLKLKKFRR